MTTPTPDDLNAEAGYHKQPRMAPRGQLELSESGRIRLKRENTQVAPDPDPKPWACVNCSDRFVRDQVVSVHSTEFKPRPAFSQNREDYLP